VEPLDLRHSIRGDIPSEGDSQIIPKSEELTTLVLQVVDELAILTILASQGLLLLEDGCVDLASTMLKEHVLDVFECCLADGHHHWRHISGSFGALR